MRNIYFFVKKYQFVLLVLLFIADGIFSFFQYINMPLDGDMSAIILPAEWYSKVLESPLGLKALVDGETYGGSNRFFSHWSMSKYFKTIPFLIQNFTNPIDSLFISCALFKTIIQIGLIFILATYIKNTLKFNLLPIVCLLFPFFQAHGFYAQMGIIDQSITYVFFYAFPLLLTLIWFLPFYTYLFIKQKTTFPWWHWLYLIPLMFIISFSGPLVQPIIFLVCPITLLFWFLNSWLSDNNKGSERLISSISRIPKTLMFAFIGITLIALYAYYIGTFNVENINNNTLALSERYVKLAKGLIKIFTVKLGLPIIILAISINIFILKKYNLLKAKHHLFILLLAIIIFSTLYLLLLPLGGYRDYRPYIIRYDTLLPISICLISYCVLTSCYVISILPKRKKRYLVGIIMVLFVFQLFDEFKSAPNNCEKRMLAEIASSKTSKIKLTENCRVLGWHSFKTPNESKINAEMLYYWKVTDKQILYYYK